MEEWQGLRDGGEAQRVGGGGEGGGGGEVEGGEVSFKYSQAISSQRSQQQQNLFPLGW